LCAIVFYKKVIKGKTYPRAARTGPYAYAQEVVRIDGKVVTKYIGIVRIPERAAIADDIQADVMENENEQVVTGTRDTLEGLPPLVEPSLRKSWRPWTESPGALTSVASRYSELLFAAEALGAGRQLAADFALLERVVVLVEVLVLRALQVILADEHAHH
jgi:hypothetical protein